MLTSLMDRIDEKEIKELLAMAIFPDPESVEARIDEYKTNDHLELYGYRTEDGRLVGLIGIKVDEDSGTLTIEHLAVHPTFRGFGYGRGQILELISLKRPQKIVAENDAEAVEFYRNNGFIITSLGEKYPGTERFKCEFIVEE